MTAADSTNPQLFQQLIEFTEDAMQRLHVPGTAVGLYHAGQEYSAGLGITNVENPLPVTPETLFMIGSITKTYTATVLFRLIEQGRLALDDRLRQFMPGFKVQDEEAGAGVTVRQLLNHTAGWLGDYPFVSGHGEDALARYVESLGTGLEQMTALGEVFTYNNTSFNIAGRLIEVLTGKTYEQAVREMVLEPLGMTNSFFFFDEVMIRRFAVGHIWNEEKGNLEIASPWGFERCENPAGGLVSDVHDQLKFARFHMGDGRGPNGARLLSPETLRLMQTPSVKGDMTWMGTNWFIWDIGGVRFIDHDGSTNGQQAALWFAPEHDLALCVLTNLEQGYLLHAEVTRWVRKQVLGVEEGEPEPLKLSAEAQAEYAGRYETSWKDIFAISPCPEGILMTHIPAEQAEGEQPSEAFPPMRCACIEEDRFLFLDPPFKGWKFDFLRGPDGKIKYLRFSGRVMKRV